MKTGKISLCQTDTVLLNKVQRTETYFERARGLLGRAEPAENEGLLICPCNSIHTCFMGYGIDAVFMDGDMRVLKIIPRLPPWRFSSSFKAAMVLELKAGMVEKLKLKTEDRLIWTDQDTHR